MEDKILLTDEEISTINTDDITKMYLNEIKRYPLLSSEEVNILIDEYRSGNLEAKKRLTEGNLRLVVKFAYHYTQVTKSMSFLDLIQEGNIGLMRAIETYDKEKGAFSTYATSWIKQKITRSISDKDQTIRRPVHVVKISRKYDKLKEEYYDEYKMSPSDEYIKEELQISDEMLEYFKNKSKYETSSLNKKMNNEDSESDEIIDFVATPSKNYDDVIDNIDTFNLLCIIKDMLTPVEYYILYNRVLSESKMTLESLAPEFNLTRERIRQLESKALYKIKSILRGDSSIYQRKLDAIQNAHGKMYYKLRVNPIAPDDICMFLYLEDKLSELEQNILYLKHFSQYNYTIDDIRKIIGISTKEFNTIYDSLNRIIKRELNNSDDFNNFKFRTKKEQGRKIYNIQLINKKKIIDYNTLSNRYSNVTLDELSDIFGSKLDELGGHEKAIIYKYFDQKEEQNMNPTIINREVNLLLSGYKERRKTIDINKLYRTLINNKDSFTEEQILFLECYVFNTKIKQEFLDRYQTSSIPRHATYLMDRLEMLHYGIYKILENNFNKEKYLSVKETHSDKLGQERIKLLDLYYGINCPKKSIQEIANIYGKTYVSMHDILRDAREYAINLYANRNSKIDIDKSLYVKYILDERFLLPKETRNILKLFIIENKSYDEIRCITGLTNTRISNIITESIRKMDNYRFNLISFDDYTMDDLKQFYEIYGELFNDIEKSIIEDRYIHGIENKDTSNKYNVSLSEVNKLIGRFNKLYFKYRIKDIQLSQKEIQEEIEKTLIESVTTEREKEILSYYYGIENGYNNTGIKLNSKEICSKLNITKNVYHHVFTFGIEKIKGRKIGITKPELLYIEKNELKELLKDAHLPISEKEREIICSFFGIYNYPTKTLEELSELYEENETSIKRRYMRSIVSILKYKNHEIEGTINYDTDILPNLKYFSNCDCLLIEEHYKNKLTYKELSQKYSLTRDQVISIFNRIKPELFEIIKNPSIPRFDFEFYEKNQENTNLPFYGNVELANKIFRLYFGMDKVKRMSVPEIIKELNLSSESSFVNKLIYDYMLAICKLKDGIEKQKEFTYEEIKDCYSKHKSTMSTQLKISYLGYFKRIESQPYFYSRRSNINDLILYEM